MWAQIQYSKNSFCIQSKYYVKIASDFAPPPPKQISARKRAEFSESPRKTNTNSVGGALRRPLRSSFKTFEFYSGASIVPNSHLLPKQMMWHARSAWWLETKSYARDCVVKRMARASSAPFGRGSKNQKFSLPFLFSSAGGVGGADKKWKGNFWFCFAVYLTSIIGYVNVRSEFTRKSNELLYFENLKRKEKK